MTDPISPADRMLAEIRDWAETLPTRCPTILRVATGVQDELKRSTEPAVNSWASGRLPHGVTVIEDPSYPPGMWRIFDQQGEEISAGVLPVPGATLTIKFDDGSSKTMQVIAVNRDRHGRIVDYTVVDPALFEIPEPTGRLFPQYLPARFR